MKPGSEKNFTVFGVLDWIATLTAHIPNKGEQLVRYYGYYRNVSRGKRKKEKPVAEGEVSWKPECIEVAPPTASKELKKRWSYFNPSTLRAMGRVSCAAGEKPRSKGDDL